jgi:lysophospholipase L1-like esterase
MWRGIGRLFVVVLVLGVGSTPRAESAPPAFVPATANAVPKDLDRHEEFLARIKAGPIGVVFFGDSITDGWRGVGEGWEKAFGEYQPANFGISGDGTQHVLWRMIHGELDGYHPRVIVVMIGTNNMGASEEDVVQGVTAVVHMAHEKQPESNILLLAIFPREEKVGEMRQKVQRVNEQLAKLADGQKIWFWDIGGQFINPDGTISKEIMYDFLHLTYKGYEIWANAMGPILAQMMN